MSLKFGTSAVNTVTYNGNDVKQIKYNDSFAWCKPYTLSISKGTGVASITVSRTSTLEPTASTGSISAGSGTIFHGDKLSVSATASTGYLLNSYTTSYTVSGNTSVSVTATALPKITLTKNTHVKTISLTYVDSGGTSHTVTAAGTYYAKNGSSYSWSATADDYCYMTSGSSGSGTLSGDISISPTADYGYYTVSLDAITSATAYVNTSASNYASSVTAKYGSTIYVQVKPNNCYIYTINNTNYTPSSPYTTSYVLNSTNFNLSSTTPATSTAASNKPTATRGIFGGSVSAAYYKVTLTVTNGTVISGATTTIRYGNSISYTAKGNSKYYYIDKTLGGYGDSGYPTTYTPTSSVLPADGGATEATAIAVSHTVGSCTAYKTYTIKTTLTGDCRGNTFVKSVHALGETKFKAQSTSGTSSTVYETDYFYSYAEAKNMGQYKLTSDSCRNNGKIVWPKWTFLTVGGSGNSTRWITTDSLVDSTQIIHRADFGTSDSPKTVNGNVDIEYEGAVLTYTYYPYNSNIYSSKINSGTTYVNVYDRSKVSEEIPYLAYYPASAIRINGCICLQKDGTNTEFANLSLWSTKTANLNYAGISGTAKMGNQGPASGNSGEAQRQYLSVSKKAGSYKFYIRIWGLSIPS